MTFVVKKEKEKEKERAQKELDRRLIIVIQYLVISDNCQSEVCDDASEVSFHQDVLGLQIAMGDAAFALKHEQN